VDRRFRGHQLSLVGGRVRSACVLTSSAHTPRFRPRNGLFLAPNRRMAASALMSLGVDIARWYRDDGLYPAEIAEACADMAVRSLAFH